MSRCMEKPKQQNGMEMSLEVKSCLRIRWKVKIPEHDTGYNDHFIQSPNFEYRNAEYCFTCFRNSDEICLAFEPQSESCLRYSVIVQVEKSVGYNLPYLSHIDSHIYKDGWIWQENISEINNFFPDFRKNSELTFIIKVHADKWESSTGEKSVQTSLCINSIPCSESLSEDLEKLLQLDSHSDPDVEFQSDGHCIKAHKLVVSTRSPVLSKMLQSQMVEGATGIVKIEDMDLETLKLFMHYLYTGRLEEAPTFEVTIALYEAADKYEVKSLFKWCARYLLENMTLENACDVLAVADAHSDEELVEKVTVFILENKMPISDDEPWSTFNDSHPKLANKVYRRFCKKICK